jgi:polysaccharide biosynthesis transport protein
MSDNHNSGSESRASRPIYYGGQNPAAEAASLPHSSALYYGGRSPAAYATTARSPALYYGGAAPTAGYPGGYGYGAGGYYYGGAGSGISDDDDSLTGAITIGRMIRVCSQRWITIFVFVIIGLVASFAVFKISPVVYEARAVFEMSLRRPSVLGLREAVIDTSQGTMSEVFNTRLARLRSRAVIDQIVTQYRSDYPSSTVSDEELISTLVNSEMELQRRSMLITITVQSTDKKLAADLANAYAKAAETFTAEQNRNQSEMAVAWLHTTTEQQKRALERADKEMLEYRVAHQLDTMENESEIAKQSLANVNTEIMSLQSELTKARELQKTLEAIQNEPEKFGSLPESIPRTAEIGIAYAKLLTALADKNSLMARYTANHPEVKVKEKEVEIYRQQFADVVYRALETCKANVDLLQRQLGQMTPEQERLMKKISDLELKTVTAQMKLDQLAREREVADINYKALLQRTNEAQLDADQNTALIKQVEQAFEPNRPVKPNPMIIFPAGPVLGLIFGILFVLVLDHLEDKIVGVSDIEQRLRLKTLAVIPHVRRKKREQLALAVKNEKFSQFAEAIAGLRNLLDSPRYAEISKVCLCMSTQPGEGKTITSSSLAISCAQSGQKTLLVDCDMRRPRLARIFEKKSAEYKSLPHRIREGGVSSFDDLSVASGIENLDLVLSKASSEINPANLMGSGSINEFFAWARQNYDRVFIDSPPYGIVGDVMVLASLSDAVMMMCCPDRTRFRPIKHAARTLTESGARVIGVIVNDVDFGRRNQFSQYDYHYRYAYRYTSRYGAYGQGKKFGIGGVGKSKKQSPETAMLDDDDLTPSAATMPRDVVDHSMLDDDD